VRYGKAGQKPEVLWDGIGLVAAINGPIVLPELVPDMCSALSSLSEYDADVGYAACDSFFEAFTSWLLGLAFGGKVAEAADKWVGILRLVLEWEKSSKTTIHKGTPYYFLGATYLFSKDFVSGLRYIFDAIEQDKKASARKGAPDSFKNAPAYMVASLVEDPNNFLYLPLVLPARRRLDEFLEKYRAESSSSMALKDLESKFLKNTALEFQKFSFVYLLFELIKQETSWNPGLANDFANMRSRAILFDLCLVIDEVLRNKFPYARYISDGVFELFKSKGWLSSETDAGQLNAKLNPKVAGGPLPDVVVPALLNLSLTYNATNITPEMSWYLLAWHLRNYGAHDLKPQAVLAQRNTEIIQALMNALFASLE
jgi:hypothetical protein